MQQLVTEPRRQQPPRARPVVDLPSEALQSQLDELAQRWAIALILARPLDAIGGLPLEELAREAPALCGQVLRALESDTELERLAQADSQSTGPGTRPQAILSRATGAHDAASLTRAAEALRGVLWEALLDALTAPSVRLVADVSDRLAYACAVMLESALEASLTPAETVVGASRGDSGHWLAARWSGSRPQPREGAEPSPVSRAPSRSATIVDEHEPAEPALATASPTIPAAPGGVSERVSSPPASPYSSSSRPRRARTTAKEIEIRDQRGREGPAAWIGSIGAQLQREGQPFAVMLVELVDIERLRREEAPEQLARLGARVEHALAAELEPRAGTLTRERPGRCWLIAPDTDRAAARELAERLAHAVASSLLHRGAPLAVTIGTAVCPEDGREAAELAAHADVALYAARASGRAPASRRGAPPDVLG
jgi:GGDEF domain-containing protein